jgi:hypothetical protein
MSNAIAVIAQNTGASPEDITEVLKGMIVSAKNQHGAQATNAELAIVTGVCATYGLNPLVKECAAFVSGGKLSVVVMVDGWYKMVNRRPEFDGVEFGDKFDANGNLTAITCRMFIKGRERPVCVTEYMAECKDTKSSVWTKWPARMLRHKAYIQCARMAFGISEIIDDDEASRIAANAPTEKVINPAAKIDWEGIQADMAECGDVAALDAACMAIRRALEGDGLWQQAKDRCILMKSEHLERIRAYSLQEDVLEGELVTADPEQRADDNEMEFE